MLYDIWLQGFLPLSLYTPPPSLVVQLDLHALVVHEIHAPPNRSDETRPFEVDPAATEKGRTFEQIVSCLTFDLDQMSSQAEQRLTCKRPCRPFSNESPSIPFLLPRSVGLVRLLRLCHPRLLGTASSSATSAITDSNRICQRYIGFQTRNSQRPKRPPNPHTPTPQAHNAPKAERAGSTIQA
jgi:hypothetical protein